MIQGLADRHPVRWQFCHERLDEQQEASARCHQRSNWEVHLASHVLDNVVYAREGWTACLDAVGDGTQRPDVCGSRERPVQRLVYLKHFRCRVNVRGNAYPWWHALRQSHQYQTVM